jgi:hypothetical protein
VKSADYWIITAPGGSGLKHAVARLVEDLTRLSGRQDMVIAQDVEDELCALARRSGFIPETAPSMLDVTYKLQREQVIRLWGEALDISISKLAHSRAKSKLLSCHLTLYGGRRREYYSPIDVKRLVASGLQPSRLLLLVDDAFDMFARLTQPGYLHDFGDSDYVDEVGTQEGITSPAVLKTVRPQLRLQWQIATLSSLLAWRRADMIMAESIARQANSKYLAFGVKQLTGIATRWLSEAEPEPIYLSHPISRPRRDPKWPRVDLVDQFNELQSGMAPHGALCIMPTSIDEYRFKRKKIRGRSIARLEPRLAERWPIPTQLPLTNEPSDYRDTLYAAPPSGPKLPNLFEHRNVDSLAADSWLRSFEGQVSADISFRDHHLVACCPHLLVFRPLYKAGTFSRGVRAEIAHWQLLASDRLSGATRQAVFVHFREDLTDLKAIAKDSIHRSVLQHLEVGLTEIGVARESARHIVRVVGRDDPGRSLLDTGPISPPERRTVNRQWPKVRRAALAVTAWEQLTSMVADDASGTIETQVAIWIVDDRAQLHRELPRVASFLRRTQLAPTKWKALAAGFLDVAGIPPTLRI